MTGTFKDLIISTIIFLCFSYSATAQDFTTPFEKSKGTKTATYEEGMEWWKKLDSAYDIIKIDTGGLTDAGIPLHEIMIDIDNVFTPQPFSAKSKNVIFINNAIHPGEPDGVDACMLLARDICQNKELQQRLKHTIIVIVPFYNIGGALNRNAHSRANQNGPESYGFRGNAKNYDLNRDLIKQDAKNSESLVRLIAYWNPDVFIDTHVSNGADYQYTMTLLATQPDKLGGECGHYMRAKFLPELFQKMADRGQEMTPYVNVHDGPPDEGFTGFYDSPRYGSGYAATLKIFSFVTETHMLKPFDKRVQATLDFLLTMVDVVDEKGAEIKAQRIADMGVGNVNHTGIYYPINWVVDTTRYTELLFKGYKGIYPISNVTQLPQLKYDKAQPYAKKVKYYEYFKATDSISMPYAYIIPARYSNIAKMLEFSGVKLQVIKQEGLSIPVEVYYIKNYDTRTSPYEGHYLHYHTEVETLYDTVDLHKGDYVITNVDNGRVINLLINTLEPQADDSYFNWGFFDIILQQKEWFSDYVFDDIAEEILENDPDLKRRFYILRKNPDFANNRFEQLYFIYRNSPYYEKVHMRYPIYRAVEPFYLPIKP